MLHDCEVDPSSDPKHIFHRLQLCEITTAENAVLSVTLELNCAVQFSHGSVLIRPGFPEPLRRWPGSSRRGEAARQPRLDELNPQASRASSLVSRSGIVSEKAEESKPARNLHRPQCWHGR